MANDEPADAGHGTVEWRDGAWRWEWRGAGLVGSGRASTLAEALASLASSAEFTGRVERNVRARVSL